MLKLEKVLKTGLIWLPSLVVSIVFIENAYGKIFHAGEMDKIVSNNAVIVSVGLILIVATILFLFDKTLVIGASILALYMTCITFIHLIKGKPFEVVVLIVMCTIFAAYIRKPELFKRN